MRRDRADQSHWAAKKRVTLVGLAANGVLAVGKVIAGVAGQSQALVADGVHSFSDLASDGLVLVAVRWGSESADQNHPYGHARIETAATAVIGVMLMVVAAGFIMDASARVLDPERLLSPGWLALVAAVISVLINEGLFRYTLHVGQATGSSLIKANAWHSRSDALSSLVVIAGVAGTMIGYRWLDLIAALIVALMIGRMGWRFLAQSVVELVDTGLSEARERKLDELIRSVHGVRDHGSLRTRQMGGRILMDVEVVMDGDLSLSAAHEIAHRLERHLLDQVPELDDVVVRMQPPSSDDGA
ncbi:MAG: cation diffusion facilitator family transporter [Pseudomonadota bacterium]